MSEAQETPATMAPKLGVTPVALRQWLRGLVDAKHELVKHHRHNDRWTFSAQDAQTLLAAFRQQHP